MYRRFRNRRTVRAEFAFSVTKDVVSAEGVPELNVDDNIRVVFNGDVMESDPLQIGTVYAIYLLDENGEVIPNN